MMTSASIVPLKCDNNLLDSSFDGYKLSLDKLPIYTTKFEQGVQDPVLKIQEDQSYFVTKLAGLYNNLKNDLWSSGGEQSAIYFCNSSSQIIKYEFTQKENLRSSDVVWTIPEDRLEYGMRAGCNQLPVSIQFPSSNIAIVADGKGHLYVLDTGDRTKQEFKHWQMVHKTYQPLENDQPFVVCDARMSRSNNPSSLDCLLLWVGSTNQVEHCDVYHKRNISYVCVIDWITITRESSGWMMHRCRRLLSPSYPEYISLCLENQAVVVASNRPFVMTYDSLSPVVGIEAQMEDKSDGEPNAYTWYQTEDEIIIVFSMMDDVEKSDIEVELTDDNVKVMIKEQSMFAYSLFHDIKTEMSSWIFSEEKRLVLTLVKKLAGESWDSLGKDGDDGNGQEITDAGHVQQLQNSIQKLSSRDDNVETDPAFNAGEYEECDDMSEVDSFMLQAIHGTSHLPSHQVDLSGHQFLFSEQLKAGSNPILCLRHDVDGVIWQPVGHDTDFSCQHTATFNALGYVQASKQDRKYLVCAPDFGFVALACVKRHIHVYKQPSLLDSSVELRNRKSGQRVSSVAKQHVISLESTDSILGMVVTKRHIFAVTAGDFYAIDVGEAL